MTTERHATSGTSNLAPGGTVGNGRYRLLACHGGRPHLQFWQGLDQASGEEVALTLVDTDGALPDEFVHEILASTVRLKGIDMPGVARVQQVFHTGRFGVVVSEWIYGGALGQIAETAPSPTGVAGAMQSLAAAAEAAHRAGLLLSIDDPARVRVGVDGHAALAFPATMPEANAASDLHGIGWAMCVLLNAEPGDKKIPFLISTTMSGLLNGEIGSAATLLTLLREASGTDIAGGSVMPPLPAPPSGGYAEFRNFGAEEQAAAARRQMMRVAMATAAVIAVVALVALGSTLNNVLGDDHHTVGFNADKLGLTPPTASAAEPPPEVKRAAADRRIQPAGAIVFSPEGSPDSPESAGATIDGNPATAWSTDTYYDADPFPKFKSGIGVLLQLERPATLSAVTVDLNSTGTVVQLRGTGDTPPKTLADTTELSPPTPMQQGHNRVPVASSAPVSNVLVWISKLGSADGKNRSAVSEIELQAASPPA
jgi:putative peptidoglycan lipid II flippase